MCIKIIAVNYLKHVFLLFKVIEGIEVVARENIPGSERIELAQLLSGQFPPEAIAELQARIDQIAFRK